MSSVVVDIDTLVAQQSRDQIAAKVRRLAEQLATGDDYTDEQVAAFDAVISRLAEQADRQGKADISEILARHPRAPREAVRLLAQDEDIGVAEPILMWSERVEIDTLVDVVETRSQPHLLAVARRRDIGPEVSDALIARGDRSVLQLLSRHRSARFSSAGMLTLSGRLKAIRREQRTAPRKPLDYPASLAFEAGGANLGCTLVDISKTGARLFLQVPRQVPPTVYLSLVSGGAALRRCEVVWQSGQVLGVRFLTPAPGGSGRTP